MTELWSKKKKILTRKERFRISEDFARKKEKEENVEKLLLQKEEQIERLEWEEKIKYEKADKEQVVRRWRLKPICGRFRSLLEGMTELQLRSRDAQTVADFPEIGAHLARIVPWVNERLSKWRRLVADRSDSLNREIEECFLLLATLNRYIENPLDIENLHFWCQCRSDLRDELLGKLDQLSYRVLKNIETNMAYLSADIRYQTTTADRKFSLALWTVPQRGPIGKDDKFPLQCQFEESGVTASLPKSFQFQAFAVRCLVVFEDYLSGDCRTFREPEWAEGCAADLDEYHSRRWSGKEERRQKLADDERDLRQEWERRRSIINKIKHLVPSPSIDVMETEDTASKSEDATDGEVAPPKDLEYLSKVINLKRAYVQFSVDEERTEIENVKRHFAVELDKFECNMRKYYIVGGVYHVSLLKQPPQPKVLRDGAVIRLIEGKDGLQRWPYLETYEPPTIKASGPVKQPTDDDDEDAENTPEGALLSKLVLIVIKLPDHVLWFDAPLPVHWDDRRRYWSSEYIYEAKFNEEKQTLSFHAGVLSTFGLAVFRYNQFPFQSWELKPDPGDAAEVHFNLTTSTLVLEFRVRPNRVCLATLDNANTNALQELVNVFYEPTVLVRLLRNGGVSIFPGDDGCLYVDGSQLKHRVTEDHIYHCMAALCCCYQFGSCRWNMMAGYRRFVLQAMEVEPQRRNRLLVVTDERAFVTESTDVTQALSECDGMEMTFYPDLMSWVEDCSVRDVKSSLQLVDPILVETVYFMLAQTRILCLS